MSSTRTRGRNAPCPCGSGKKYKNCCENKPRIAATPMPRNKAYLSAFLALVIVLLLGIGVMIEFNENVQKVSASKLPVGKIGVPGEYDAANDQHWDADHNHWHPGPPPGGVPAAEAGPTPEPWTYDAVKNQHWVAEHNHWHDGPPPAPEDR